MSKSILITGASSGIGKAVAYEMARKGYSLALASQRADLLNDIKDNIRKQFNPPAISVRNLDVTNYDEVLTSVKELADEIGGLDIVFANAGVALGEKVGRGDFEKARRTIEVNLIGAIATVDAAVEYFLKKGRGHIVGTSSVAAFRGMPRSSAYSASKAGLAIYLEAARAELYRKNIDITVLYPGYIDTPLNDMLPSRPFLISVEKGAAIITRLIEKKVKSSTVPVYPWNIVGRLLKILPTNVISKF
ncbi:MAG: SDR family oxidoreductase [Desulfobacterales bacterium]|jgi:hypothetical protein|nr:SDR family oxidoreductase [Desulfobacterales bacterium]